MLWILGQMMHRTPLFFPTMLLLFVAPGVSHLRSWLVQLQHQPSLLFDIADIEESNEWILLFGGSFRKAKNKLSHAIF